MKRLDIVLTERGLTRSRTAAVGLIKGEAVTVNGKIAVKPSFGVSDSDIISIVDGPEFVSRGGLKLKKAINVFGIDLSGAVCADIGASTGGFTDCMLKNGAEKVYAVDVGSGQLVKEIADDPRVVNMENTNIRYLQCESIGEVDFVGCDVSFISLSYVFPTVRKILKQTGCAVFLIKPQFEAGKGNIGKNGIVKSAFIHESVINKILHCAEENGLHPAGIDYSPIKGGEGNLEFLLYINQSSYGNIDSDVKSTVEKAHLNFGGVK